MYGTQTGALPLPSLTLFENDVKMYGTQTYSLIRSLCIKFENDVKMYGTQTIAWCWISFHCLRMM